MESRRPKMGRMAVWTLVVCGAHTNMGSLGLQIRQGEWRPGGVVRQATGKRGFSGVKREATATVVDAPPSRTQRILETLEYEGDGAGAGASGTYKGLLGLDGAWSALKQDRRPPVGEFVRVSTEVLDDVEYDVVILGGTLGIFAAAALQTRGIRCCVVERGAIKGRAQEWNLSLDEVEALVRAGALGDGDVDGAVGTPGPGEVLAGESKTLVASAFGSVRAGFHSAKAAKEQEIWLPEVLNIGVRPDVAVERALKRFVDAGGVVLEGAACSGVSVRPNGVEVSLPQKKDDAAIPTTTTARLLIDAMGNASPIARQARTESNGGVEPAPSGVCCVVGTTATGYELDNSFGDLILTNEDARKDRQYFWEAFPARSIAPDARTTYLFTYLDPNAAEDHDVLGQFEDYWRMLPKYQRTNHRTFDQGLDVDAALSQGTLSIKRALYGLFPTYRDSPLPSRWDRVLAVGDASGVQSPLSFGGFGALTRHLDRVVSSIDDALKADALTKSSLTQINQYAPNLSVTWMFQNAFVQSPNRPPDFVNRLMRLNYDIMRDLGDDILRPFNQDVVQPRGLLAVLVQATLRDPANIPRLLYFIGPVQLADWLKHFSAMFLYDALHHAFGDKLRAFADNTSDPKLAFDLRRLADAWEFGSGNDYGRH